MTKASRLPMAATILMVATLAASCATTIAGSAQPVPGQGPVKQAADPCSLVAPDQAAALGLEATGTFTDADPSHLVPATCRWRQGDKNADSDPLAVAWSVDMSLDTYLLGARPIDQFPAGGLTWTRYGNAFGRAFCELDVKLSENSFAEILTSNLHDETKACDMARAAAPLVASHLPGGAPAPPLPPSSSSSAPVPSGPLVTVDGCTLLKPEQAAQLKLVGTGNPLQMSSDPNVRGCEWVDTDGARGQKAFDLWLAPAKRAKDWPGLEAEGQLLEVAGRTWSVFPNPDALSVNCSATLAVTDTSSAMVTSGYLDDKTKMCDLVKAAIPLVTANLPAS